MRKTGFLAAITLLVLASPAGAAEGESWQLSQKMVMQGMSMPAMSSKICVPKDAPADEMVPSGDDNCRMTDLRSSGSKTSYRFECTGKEAASGEGEFERLGPDAYRGRTVMRSEDGEMILEYEGRRMGGACDPDAPMKRAAAQMAAAEAEQCRRQGEALEPPGRNPQLPPEMDFGCDKANKSAYCEGVKARRGAVEGRDDFRSLASKSGWRGAFGFCGLDAASLEKRYCDEALAEKDYHYVADACEADARRIASTCAGRDGTSLSAAGQSALLPICSRYGPGAPVMVERAAEGSAAPEGEQAEPPKKESALDKLKKGSKGLKDLIRIPGT